MVLLSGAGEDCRAVDPPYARGHDTSFLPGYDILPNKGVGSPLVIQTLYLVQAA